MQHKKKMKSILLFRLGGLGDLLVAFPSIYLLRKELFPCSITLVCREEYGSLLKETGVVDNLVSNAIKYGKEQGQIAIEAAEEDDHVTVSVWNEGQGIRKEDLPHLFEKFVRFRQATKKAKKGTGLGLFISKEIVGKHGGKIWAESEEGKWARFSFSLPK